MSVKFALCAFAVWAALACDPAVAVDYEPDIFVSGSVDMQVSLADEGALAFNRQRRGDSPFNRLRGSLFADVAVNERLTLFNHLPVDVASGAALSSFLRSYLRIRMYSGKAGDLHLQLGKIPTPFGHFGERSYSDVNPLVGYPLMYHYSTSLRSNQLPADNADLLRQRGSGVAPLFSGYRGGGSAARFSGLPLIYESCWDFGGGLEGSYWRFEYLVALTRGTLSDPRSNTLDNNDGRQFAVRIGFVPFTGALLRLSLAEGPYLDRAVADTLAAAGRKLEDFDQRIAGISAEYGVRHLLVIAEAAVNRWQSPNIRDAAGRLDPLEVIGFYVEGSYKLRAGLSAAARFSGLRFADIEGANGATPWDYDVDRIEMGISYRFDDHTLCKLTAQLNDSGRAHAGDEHIATSQLTVLF